MVMQPTLTSKMTFLEAMGEIAQGRKVTRLEWADTDEFCYMNGGTLSVHHSDGKTYIWQVIATDMAADDWIILE
jgi:L-asparaginase/Glu-tRNA(Gln) amidotransferase subunit D